MTWQLRSDRPGPEPRSWQRPHRSEEHGVRTREAAWTVERRTGDSSQPGRFLVVRRNLGPPEIGLRAFLIVRSGFKILKNSLRKALLLGLPEGSENVCVLRDHWKVFGLPASWKAAPAPQAQDPRNLLPEGSLMAANPPEVAFAETAHREGARRAPARALVERPTGCGRSRTPASCNQDLLSAGAGLR